MIPITKPFFSDDEIEAVSSVMKSGWIVQGSKVEEFENLVARHEGVRFCCATTSCTTALQLAMLAEGMGEKMDVFVPSFTFVATANAVESTGARPVLLDIDEKTFNISAEIIQKKIDCDYVDSGNGYLINKYTRNRLWGFVPVHQFGLCADMHSINEIKEKYNLKIVEDAACAMGSNIDGIHAGGFGNAACVSFHPRKSITTGEGGMVLTDNEEIYKTVVALRNHGSIVDADKRHNSKNGGLLPQFVFHGYNFRMTDIQGAIGCAQMNKLDYILERRQEIAKIYDDLFEGSEKIIKTPYKKRGYFHTYQSYVCLLNLSGDNRNARNEIMDELIKAGISTRQGTHAVHKLDFYKNKYGYRPSDLPNSDRCDVFSISLPVYVDISRKDQELVADRLLSLLS